MGVSTWQIIVILLVVLLLFGGKKIPELAKIIVFARPNYSIKALNSIASKRLKKKDWMYINAKKMNISSSLIRKF